MSCEERMCHVNIKIEMMNPVESCEDVDGRGTVALFYNSVLGVHTSLLTIWIRLPPFAPLRKSRPTVGSPKPENTSMAAAHELSMHMATLALPVSEP